VDLSDLLGDEDGAAEPEILEVPGAEDAADDAGATAEAGDTVEGEVVDAGDTPAKA
jgi:hypothetical protein